MFFFSLLGESPRWLLAEGRYDEGIREVKRAARMNKRQVPVAFLNSEMTTLTHVSKRSKCAFAIEKHRF